MTTMMFRVIMPKDLVAGMFVVGYALGRRGTQEGERFTTLRRATEIGGYLGIDAQGAIGNSPTLCFQSRKEGDGDDVGEAMLFTADVPLLIRWDGDPEENGVICGLTLGALTAFRRDNT